LTVPRLNSEINENTFLAARQLAKSRRFLGAEGGPEEPFLPLLTLPTDFRIQDMDFCTKSSECFLLPYLSCVIRDLLAKDEYFVWKGNCSRSGRAWSIRST